MDFDLDVIGAGLPVARALGDLEAALFDGPGASGAVVVQAPPGTGKTTLVPVAVANRVAGRVVVTQPRRVAARASARRVSSLAGTRVGEEVGYVVRGEQKVSARTRVEFCTAGVMLRRLLTDPELDGVGAAVLDEVHERALESDLVFAMLVELRELRPELVVVVMSATLDAGRWAELLGSGEGVAPIVRVEADLHPLDVRWAPASGLRMDARGVTPRFLDHLAEQASSLVDEKLGDVLVFVPGARECDRVVERLRQRGIEADALHGSLSPREQDRVLGSSSARSSSPDLRADSSACHASREVPRVIVATSIAESSLTVPGVRAVVDSGLAREPRHDQGRGMSGLVTVAEARSSAEQRAGRAARLGPGVVVRCFPSSDWAGMRPFVAPEITSDDLVQAALDLACWGSPGGVGLALPDAPPVATLAVATEVLQGLGALDKDGRPTDLGRALSRLPVDPRLGRALLECSARFDEDSPADPTAPTAAPGPTRVAEVVAMLAGDERAPGGDLLALLRALRRRRDPRWLREAERLTRLARDDRSGWRYTYTYTPIERDSVSDEQLVAAVVAAAWPERIARARRDGAHDYLTTGGTGVELAGEGAGVVRDGRGVSRGGAGVVRGGSGAAGGAAGGTSLRGSRWLAVAEMGRVGERAVIRAAVPIDEESAREAASGLLVDRTVAQWREGRVSARRVVGLGAIELSSTPVRPSVEQGAAAVAEALRERGLRQVLDWGEGVEALRRRLTLAHHVLGEPWPAMDDESLVARADEWLGPELRMLAEGTPASRIDVVSALRRLLPWPEAGRLDELVPERLEVPTGSRIRLDYPADPDGRVVLAVKLQECFGLLETPRILDGRLPVLMHLLSPARRPLAVTDDLASFWVNAYPGVRAENRGRYIKHPWPEDPLTAPPRRGTTRSGR